MDQNSKMVQWVSISIIIASIIISGAILYTSAGNTSGGVANNNNNNQGGNNQPTPTASGKASIDDDAVLGDQNAPITMIEFSDYECPFCKRHYDQVYAQIKKDYVDTGKVKIVFRDFIAVSSHNPLATSQAMAAQCAKEQGGDSMYFKFHDEIFKKTTSGGTGMQVSQLATIATTLGLNVPNFNQCLSSNKYQAEIDNDQKAAGAAGITGTPSFVVGKSTANGNIDGKVIVGAVPYTDFKAAFDALLAN